MVKSPDNENGYTFCFIVFNELNNVKKPPPRTDDNNGW